MQLFYQWNRREDTKTSSQKNHAKFQISICVQKKLVCHDERMLTELAPRAARRRRFTQFFYLPQNKTSSHLIPARWRPLLLMWASGWLLKWCRSGRLTWQDANIACTMMALAGRRILIMWPGCKGIDIAQVTFLTDDQRKTSVWRRS